MVFFSFVKSESHIKQYVLGATSTYSLIVGAPNLKKGLQGRIWKLSPLSGLYQCGNNI